jgi:hypothetical protein
MNKFLNFRTLLGIAIILLAFIPLSNNQPNPILLDIKIDQPLDATIEIVKPISVEITDPTDRAKLAIFNQEFANRVKSYDTDVQQLNDVYVLSASKFFKDSLVNKYENLDTNVVSLIEKVTTSENHSLTQDEKNKVSEYFMGLAWSLIQRK